MTDHNTAGIVLCNAGRSEWPDRFFVDIGGIPAWQRVGRALTAAGVDPWFVLFDEPATAVPGCGAWRCGLPDSDDNVQELGVLCDTAGAGDLLLVSGDRPVLSAAVLNTLLKKRNSDWDAVVSEDHSIAWFASARSVLEILGLILDGEIRWIDALVDSIREAGGSIDVVKISSPDNTALESVSDYAALCALANHRVVDRLIVGGVLIPDRNQVWVDEDARVDAGATLLPGVHIRGTSHIKIGASIGPNAWIEASDIDEAVVVRYSVVERCHVRSGTTVGPYAHLRDGADIGPNARIGNFVEVKASRIERDVKAAHLSYIGDAEIGENVNVGAGAITCNYDGKGKHKTIVERDAFIGTNVSLVAPIRIGAGALLAAGSTITEDVPAGARAFGRARQETKAGNHEGGRKTNV